MNRLGLYLALAFAAIASMLVTADEIVARKPAPDAQSVGKTLINRTGKGDRLVSVRPRAEPQEKITIIEVIDVRDVAIIYRSRTGEVVLFTDLVNSVTTVAKSVELPEGTVRNTLQRTIQQGPIEDLRDTERQQTLHPGCLAEVSPTFSSALSQRAVQRAVRCIADITVAIKAIQPL
jgi:hypothetical protein